MMRSLVDDHMLPDMLLNRSIATQYRCGREKQTYARVLFDSFFSGAFSG